MQQISHSEQETVAFAASFAPRLRKGDVLCLHGDLGMGKSVFARALIRSICNDPALDVPSPTYTLAQTYESPQGPLWHFDLYRLKSPDEIFELGWEDALADGITIVEWSERLGPHSPAKATHMRITGSGNSRLFDIEEPAG